MAYKYVRIQWQPGMFEDKASNGTVLEHREVAAQTLGRKLKAGEVVHHEDEDKCNNNPDNLFVFQTRGDHSAYHGGGKLIQHEDGTYTSTRSDVPIRVKRRRRFCLDCDKHVKGVDRCRDCHLIYVSRNIPNKETLQELLWAMPTTKIAETYGVSDKAVEKWCKKYDLQKPPRGYWTKLRSSRTSSLTVKAADS
jgi:hypothetical protein